MSAVVSCVPGRLKGDYIPLTVVYWDTSALDSLHFGRGRFVNMFYVQKKRGIHMDRFVYNTAGEEHILQKQLQRNGFNYDDTKWYPREDCILIHTNVEELCQHAVNIAQQLVEPPPCRLSHWKIIALIASIYLTGWLCGFSG